MSLPAAKELWTQFPRKSYWDRINPLCSHPIDHSDSASADPPLPILKTNRELVLESLTKNERLQIYTLEAAHGVSSPRLQQDLESKSSAVSTPRAELVKPAPQQEQQEEEDTISKPAQQWNAIRSASSAYNLHTAPSQPRAADLASNDVALDAPPISKLQTASTGDLLRAGPRPRPQTGERPARPRGIIYETVPSDLHTFSEEKLNKSIAEGWQSLQNKDECNEESHSSETNIVASSSQGVAPPSSALPYTISDPFEMSSKSESSASPMAQPSGKRNRFMECVLGQVDSAGDEGNPPSSLISRDMFKYTRKQKKESVPESIKKRSQETGKHVNNPSDLSCDGADDEDTDVVWPPANIADTMSSLRGGYSADEELPYVPLSDLDKSVPHEDSASSSDLTSVPRPSETNRPDSWYVHNGADMADLLAKGSDVEDKMPLSTSSGLARRSNSENRHNKHRDSAWETEYSGDAQACETESVKLARYHREVDGMFERLARRQEQGGAASTHRPRSSWLYDSEDELTESSIDISRPPPLPKDTPSNSDMAILPGPERSPTLKKNTGTDSYRARDGLEMQRSKDEDIVITYGAPGACSSSLGSPFSTSGGKERQPLLQSEQSVTYSNTQPTSGQAPPRSRTENDLGLPSINFSRIVQEADEWRTRIPHSPTPSALPTVGRRYSLGTEYAMWHLTVEEHEPIKRPSVFEKLRKFVSRKLTRAPSKAAKQQPAQRAPMARSSKLLVHGCDWQSEMAVVEQLQEAERQASRGYALMSKVLRQSSFWSTRAVRAGDSSGIGSEVEDGDSAFGTRNKRFSCLW